MVNELEGRRSGVLAEPHRENLFAVRALRTDGEVMRRFAVLDRAVEPRLAVLEGHLKPDFLVVVAGALPGAEPACGALGVAHARPDVVDRRAEGSGDDEIVAAEAAGC